MIELPKEFIEGKMCIEVKNNNENSQFLKLCSAYTKIEESYMNKLKLTSYKSFERRIYKFSDLNPITLTIVSELDLENESLITCWVNIIEQEKKKTLFELKIELPNNFIEGLSMVKVNEINYKDFINNCKLEGIECSSIKVENTKYFAVESKKLISLTKEEVDYNYKTYSSEIYDWSKLIEEQLKNLKYKIIEDFKQGLFAIKVSYDMYDDFKLICKSKDISCVNGEYITRYNQGNFIVRIDEEEKYDLLKYSLGAISSKDVLTNSNLLGIIDWDDMFNMRVKDKKIQNYKY